MHPPTAAPPSTRRTPRLLPTAARWVVQDSQCEGRGRRLANPISRCVADHWKRERGRREGGRVVARAGLPSTGPKLPSLRSRSATLEWQTRGSHVSGWETILSFSKAVLMSPVDTPAKMLFPIALTSTSLPSGVILVRHGVGDGRGRG